LMTGARSPCFGRCNIVGGFFADASGLPQAIGRAGSGLDCSDAVVVEGVGGGGTFGSSRGRFDLDSSWLLGTGPRACGAGGGFFFNASA
jgi:hypothetical protein